MPTKVEEARGAVIASCECDWHGTPKCDASEAVARLESAIREEERAKAELAIQIQREAAKGAIAATKVRVLEDLGQRFFKEGYTFKTYEKALKEARADEPVAGSATEKHRVGEYDGRTWTESDLKEPEPGGGRCPTCGCGAECGHACRVADPWIPCMNALHSAKERGE